jgi:ubiquinone/menaquinone biosynthesis C-methylase UbiE
MAKKLVDPPFQQQENVNAYFQEQSSYWKDVYGIRGVQAEIIQDRHEAILNWIDGLTLSPGSRVLEVGCGAGFMSVALAQRGFHVHAIDPVEAMIEQARDYAIKSGTSDMLSFDIGDVYSLAFDDSSFDLVIAIGVLAWLEGTEQAMQEMARVTKPNGYIILTLANRAGLASLLDPPVCPALRPIKLYLKTVFVRIGLRRPAPSMVFHGSRSIDRMLGRLGFVKIKGMTRGFGFSFFRHSVFPEPLGTRVNWKLQHLADRDIPCLRSIGMTYFVLARKESDGDQYAKPLNRSRMV